MKNVVAGMIITGWYFTTFFIFNMNAKWLPWQDEQ
jgi:hypothetical protein